MRQAEQIMSAKRTGLGKGLDALLGDAVIPTHRPETGSVVSRDSSGSGSELRLISVDLLQRGAYQPRQDMRQEGLEELADSIRAQGLVQPIIVRPLAGTGLSNRSGYEIVAGERRWRAAQIAGLESVPVVVRDIPDSAAIAVALIENIQRENLNPLEEAQALRRLIDEFDLTHQDAADSIGRSRTAVSNLLRLLDLGDVVKKLVRSGELEMGHARALLGITDAGAQAEVARAVAKKGLSVRETEQLVSRTLAARTKGSTGARPTEDPDIRRLQDELGERLAARVSIQHGRKGRGKLVIAYNSLDELDGILAHIQ
jgi:ParB family chromosome partitioning protein